MNIADSVVAAVERHPAIRSVRLVGSRADGAATDLSDWDFRVEVHDFNAAAQALPRLLAPLDPVAAQWDRLSPEWCWMLILPGPTKIDLIFPQYPHRDEPPWEPQVWNLSAIDAHFWDWMLWLRSKAARGKVELIDSELGKLFTHLLLPLGVAGRPSSIVEAIAVYRQARGDAEQRFGAVVSRDLEHATSSAFNGLKGE